MSDCRYCGLGGLEWVERDGRNVLIVSESGQRHACAEGKAAYAKKKAGEGGEARKGPLRAVTCNRCGAEGLFWIQRPNGSSTLAAALKGPPIAGKERWDTTNGYSFHVCGTVPEKDLPTQGLQGTVDW